MAKSSAFAYLRVSGKGQVKGDGFTRQRAVIDEYAKRARVKIADEYRDEGVSGTRELANRPGLAALLDQLEANGVKQVIVERADRLARDLMVSEVILARFRDLGVTVVEASGGTDLSGGDDDPTRKLIRQVLGAVSEFDKSVTVLKLRAARERIRRTTGRCEGRKPFGYYDGEPETLDRMRALYRKPRNRPRLSLRKIAATLDAEGRSTRSGKPWSAQSVKRILERC